MNGIRDMVLYGAHGVCEVLGVEEKVVNGRQQDYYVLRPVYDNKTTIFLPVNNEKSAKKMRRVLSPNEIYSLIRTMPNENSIWIDNETERKSRYKAILAEGDRAALVRVIKALYFHRQEKMAAGKKMHVSDVQFMRDAEKLLYEEFAHVLNIKREQVLPFIAEQISVEEKCRHEKEKAVCTSKGNM
jgi:CarD family transcriptional regulator